jgi:protease I
MLINEVQEQDYEVIVGIGGMGIFDILENEEIINLFREFHDAGKYTTAICGSSAILANAGLLNGVEATTYPNDMLINILKDNGAIYIDKTVVVSGKIITGNGPDASIAFGEALVSALK